MKLRRLTLLIAAALAGVAVVVPAAGAGSGDVQAIRTAAARYEVATSNGSPLACQLMTPNGQKSFVYFASMLTKTKLASCTAAVAAMAKLNESQYPSHAAYVRADAPMLQALAHAKVTVHGSRATLDYTEVTGIVHASSSMDFALVHGHWLMGD